MDKEEKQRIHEAVREAVSKPIRMEDIEQSCIAFTKDVLRYKLNEAGYSEDQIETVVETVRTEGDKVIYSLPALPASYHLVTVHAVPKKGMWDRIKEMLRWLINKGKRK